MPAQYIIKSREFGRGPAHVERFATLAGAAKYIKGQWQGAEYIDGESGFHTDYCRFTLEGFTLKDIGKFKDIDGWRDFVFDAALIEQGKALCDHCCKRPAKWEAPRRHGEPGEKVHVCTPCGYKGEVTCPYGKEQFLAVVRDGHITPYTYTPQPVEQEATGGHRDRPRLQGRAVPHRRRGGLGVMPDYDGFSIACGCACSRCGCGLKLEGYADAHGNHFCIQCNDYVQPRAGTFCRQRTPAKVQKRQAEIDEAGVT